MEQKGRVVHQRVSEKYFLCVLAGDHPPAGGNKVNTMNENQYESEPLLDDAEYEILRHDSLLARVGSNNFASLLENSTPTQIGNEDFMQQEQHPPSQHQLPQHPPPQHVPQPQQQAPDVQSIINAMPMENAILLPSNGLPVDDGGSWSNLDGLLENTPQDMYVLESVLESKSHVGPSDGHTSTSFTPDSTPNSQVPSLQIWPGQYDFKISLPVGNKDRNKWCYSTDQNKLYLCPQIAVPIQVKLLQWFDASITITPVFKDSRHRVEPVMPCFNCKNHVKNEAVDHLVMVDGVDCVYKQINDRNVVSLPLHRPVPGEVSTTLLVRLTCLTSCIGGPNRRPFCLVFTLHDSSGSVIGRQVLDLKCCKCPSRDMANEDKAWLKRHPPAQPNNNVIHSVDLAQSLKRSAPVATDGERKRRFNIKVEPGTESQYRNVKVPVEHVAKVKAYVNYLIAGDYVRHNHPNIFLYSEDEL